MKDSNIFADWWVCESQQHEAVSTGCGERGNWPAARTAVCRRLRRYNKRPQPSWDDETTPADCSELHHCYCGWCDSRVTLRLNVWRGRVITGSTVKLLNVRTPKKLLCNYPKIWIIWFNHRMMRPNDTDWMANNIDPDQTAPGSTLFAQAYLSENLESLR